MIWLQLKQGTTAVTFTVCTMCGKLHLPQTAICIQWPWR